MQKLTALSFLIASFCLGPDARADLIGDSIEVQVYIPNLSSFDETLTTTVTKGSSDTMRFTTGGSVDLAVEPGSQSFVITNLGGGIGPTAGSFFEFRSLDCSQGHVVSDVQVTHNWLFAGATTSFTANTIRVEFPTGATILADQVMTVTFTTEDPSATGFPELCNGDGGDQMGCTDCPCNNEAPLGTVGGCVNSAGISSRLIATGDPSISLPSGDTTDLRFQAEGLPPNAFGVLISGDAVAPANMANPCFGASSGVQSPDFDGLRCVVLQTRRHGGRAANGLGVIDDATGPSRVWGGEAQPADGIGVEAGFVAGQTRYFQVTHRDDPNAGCMRGLNTTQAVGVTFAP